MPNQFDGNAEDAKSDAERELEAFLYIVSHDLKEPVRGLRFHASTLLRDYAEALDDNGRRKLERIDLLATRLGDQVGALLHHSRLGRESFDREPVDLGEVVELAIREAGREPAVERAAFNLPESFPSALCDMPHLAEALAELIVNAAIYNDNDVPTISVEAKQKGERVELRVADDGIGMDERYFDDVFQTFRRLHGQDEYGSRLGMGLTHVKRIMERMDGFVRFEHAAGKGLVAVLDLPAAESKT